MGLDEIVDIQETTNIQEDGRPQQVNVVSFTTEKTAGTHTVSIPKDDFTSDKARRMAQEKAEELDAAFEAEE